MTEKPFNQISIMRDRIKANHRIKDCDKIFYQEDFWGRVYDNRVNLSGQAKNDCRQFKQLFRQPIDFRQLPSRQVEKLIAATSFFIRTIFVDQTVNMYKKQEISTAISHFKKNWVHVNWVITIKEKSISQDYLFNQIKGYIDGEAFKQYLSKVLEQIKERDEPYYQQLTSDVSITLRILPLIKQMERVCDLKVFIDQNQLFLGIPSVKKQALQLYQILNSALGKEYECYLTHFSSPLYLQGYDIKRDWKLNQIRAEVPQHMLIKCAHMFQYGDYHNQVPKMRGALIHLPIKEIHLMYQQELFQVANHYSDATNYKTLGKLFYFAYLSLLKTISRKFNCTMAQASKQLKKSDIDRFYLPKQKLIRSL